MENAPVVEATSAVETMHVADHHDRVPEMLPTSMRDSRFVHRAPVARFIAYLQTISPEKQTIALVHALEVGVTEVLARRGRFQH